jgi:hypothetical protein
MAGQDTIDLAGINPNTLIRHSGDAFGGTLAVIDHKHEAKIALLGNYVASTFATVSDGHGGTNINVGAPASEQLALAYPHA